MTLPAHPDSRSEILRLLRAADGGFVSGASLCDHLHVSRAAVWKQIAALRDLGYTIDAVPTKGYRLLSGPDRMLAEEIANGLATGLIGRRIEAFAQLDSTNLRAAVLADDGAAEGTVIVAEEQSAGKGRLGRRWSSPAGVNLYLSIILRPPIVPQEAVMLTFLSSLAVARTIESESGLRPTVKWPNDVLLNGGKIAGLLNEMNAETERINHVILGIGVNLNMQRDQFPPDLRYPATSLALELGRPVDRVTFCRALLCEIDRLYRDYLQSGGEAVRDGWLMYFHLAGQTVEVTLPDRTVRGVVQGLDSDGALLLQHADGHRERILAGDVRPL